MTFGITGKVLAIWLAILGLAIANGMLREAFLLPMLGRPQALILSGILLAVLILVVAYLSLPWFGRVSASGYAAIGLGWLCLTLTFEFAFGRLVREKSWPELLEAYTFNDGNLWPVVLLVTVAAPSIAARVRGWV